MKEGGIEVGERRPFMLRWLSLDALSCGAKQKALASEPWLGLGRDALALKV